MSSAPIPSSSRSLLALALPVLALIVAGCGSDGTTSGAADGPTVVVTTSVWADIVSNVACGGLVDVETVIPVGADAHAFEPSLADRARFEGASLIVANGLRLEEGLEDTIAAAESAGAPVLRLGRHMDTIPYGASGGTDGHAHSHGEDDDEHDHGSDGHAHAHGGDGDDPHVWFDPVRVAGVLPILAERLVADVGLDETSVEACLDDYTADLDGLDASIAGQVATVPEERRLLVTGHDTLGYFADRYGLEVIGTVSASSSGLAESNPADLETLAQLMERTGSRTVFVDATASTDDAEALARRLGDAEVVTLFTESLSEPGAGAETYLDLLATNTDRVVTALS